MSAARGALFSGQKYNLALHLHFCIMMGHGLAELMSVPSLLLKDEQL
jgi:hypothetical protein